MGKHRLLNLVLGVSGLGLATYASAFSGFGAEVDSYIKEASVRYQVSESMLRGLVKIEDGWYGKISPTGATGVGQFTRKTWNWLATTDEGRALGMQPITTRFDPRKNKRLNTLATALLARWHIGQFYERGIKLTDEHLYLAHNIGIEGLHRALQGKATAEDIRNMKRNGMKPGMSVRGFLVYQSQRFNQNKQIANFQRASSRTNTPVYRIENKPLPANLHWVSPTDTAMRWVEPSSNQANQQVIRWQNPTN
ncbi:hypothetical protein BKG92_07655 [Rodentibacter ratti]|uniref:Transglycosylase SLT domain-containing protein n=1 Tax=Rodentibacter ratti TaxID=1906745 RepID=A0A1V3KWB0_9PAST|nr:transglycosylase SLT domain-containing protein [Rodentibacter ratti]OOF81986.1 hypothetical protein BKG92_07655 [Rodentibacter ratti]